MRMELLCTAGIPAKLVSVVKEKWPAQEKSVHHSGVQILWGYLVSAVQNVHRIVSMKVKYTEMGWSLSQKGIRALDVSVGLVV